MAKMTDETLGQPGIYETIAFLRGAIGRGKTPGIFGCYSVAGGTIYARDTRMTAGAAWPEHRNYFNAPADELEAALDRMSSISEAQPALIFDPSTNILTAKLSRIRSAIQCIEGEPPDCPILNDLPWLPVPDGFNDAIKLAAQFNDKDGSRWTSGIRLMDNRVTAISNRSGVDITLDDMDMTPACVITPECAAFIDAVDPADEYASIEGAMWLRWNDGRWLRAQLMVGEFPEAVERIFNDAGIDAPVEITQAWREAYEDAAALAEGFVTVQRERMHCGKGAARVDVEAFMDVPEGKGASWEVKLLSPVIAAATHWNPGAAPLAALFIGESIRGVIMPVKR